MHWNWLFSKISKAVAWRIDRNCYTSSKRL